MKHDHTVLELVTTGVLAAVICVLAPLGLPIDPVPISLATFAVMLTSYVAGWKKGSVAVLIYLILGAVGVPVLSGYTGGLSKVIGPTGGYLIGYIPLAFCTGWFAEKHRSNVILTVAGMLIGTIILYALGTVWLAFQMKMDLKAALGAGVLPFLPGDAAKIVITQVLGPILYTALKKGGVLTK